MMTGFRLYWAQFLVMCRKELYAIFGNKVTCGVILIPCIILGFVLGYAANYNLEDAPYAVLDQSQSQTSTELLSRLDGTSLFHRVANLSNQNDINELMDNSDIVAAIVIPEDLETRLDQGEAAPVQVITDGRNIVTANLASAYISRIISQYNLDRSGVRSPVTLDVRTWFNPNQITRWFFMPGIIGMMSFIQVFLLAGLSVAREREEGTFEQLLVAPVSPMIILFGKAIAPMVVGFIQCTIIFMISYFWFRVPFQGSYPAFYLALLFYVLSSTGMGLAISAVSKNMQQVIVYVIVLMVPMALLSGIITPIRNMPEFLQIITYADPLRFALELLRRIYNEGATLSQLAFNFVPLTVISIVSLLSAAYLFRHHLG